MDVSRCTASIRRAICIGGQTKGEAASTRLDSTQPVTSQQTNGMIVGSRASARCSHIAVDTTVPVLGTIPCTSAARLPHVRVSLNVHPRFCGVENSSTDVP
jgi:hypothetical protein